MTNEEEPLYILYITTYFYFNLPSIVPGLLGSPKNLSDKIDLSVKISYVKRKNAEKKFVSSHISFQNIEGTIFLKQLFYSFELILKQHFSKQRFVFEFSSIPFRFHSNLSTRRFKASKGSISSTEAQRYFSVSCRIRKKVCPVLFRFFSGDAPSRSQ